MAQRKTTAKSKTKSRPKAKSASHKTKSSASSKESPSRASRKAGDKEVTIDRRRGGRRANENENPAPPVKLERRKKVNRRRQIDPTTCERDYTDDEVQFMNALEQYKRTSGRMFPTCSEVLEVVRSLGYVKLSPSELAAHSGVDTARASENNSDDTAVAVVEEAELSESWQ